MVAGEESWRLGGLFGLGFGLEEMRVFGNKMGYIENISITSYFRRVVREVVGTESTDDKHFPLSFPNRLDLSLSLSLSQWQLQSSEKP